MKFSTVSIIILAVILLINVFKAKFFREDMKKKYGFDQLDLGSPTTKRILSEMDADEQKRFKQLSRRFYFSLIGFFVYTFILFFVSAIFFNKML